MALAAVSAAYVAAALVASSTPGPRAWGFHLAGFLHGATRTATLGLMIAGAGALAAAALGGAGDRVGRKQAGRGAVREGRRGRWKRWLWLGILPVYATLLYALRERTYFLGDGLVWMEALRGGEEHPFSEPLSAAAWHGFVRIAGGAGFPPVEGTLAVLPVLCGLAFAALAWGIAREGVPERDLRVFAWLLLVTAGFTQIYFGYVESYPVASVAVFAYLWLGLRRLAGRGPVWLPGAALSVAVASHLATLYLLPSYFVVVALERVPRARKVLLAAIPLAGAPALLLLAGTRPEQWLIPFRTEAQGALRHGVPAHLARPYAALSWNHAVDLLNELALAGPAATLALGAWVVARRGRVVPTSASGRFLAAAAVGGLLLGATTNLAVAPAQDWDLSATLLLPWAAAGAVAFASLLAGRAATASGAGAPGGAAQRAPLPIAAGLLALGAGSTLAFVLVNASVASGIARYETLLGPGSLVTPYGRAYGYSMLAEYYEDRKDQEAALRFAGEARAAEPTNPRYWIKVGTALYNLGRFDEAIPVLEEAVRRGPDRADGRHNLGLCYARTGRIPEAVAQFRAAVARDPDFPTYQHDLGVGFAMAGQLDSARVVWAGVLRRWPEFTMTRRSYERRFGPYRPSP